MLQSLFSTWPSTLLLVAGAIFLLLALTQGMACRRHWRRQRRVAAMWRGLWLLLFLGLAVLGGGGALALRGWQGLGSETPVLRLTASQQGPGQWVLQLDFPDGAMRAVELKGDAWRVEAIVVKWQLPALLAGVPPLYRLDRLSGRYDDPAEEAEAPRSVIAFNRAGAFDLAVLKRQYTRWLPMIDTEYGSGVYLPLVDGGHYEVALMRTGALVARQISPP